MSQADTEYKKQVINQIKKSIVKNGLSFEHLKDLFDLCVIEQRENDEFNHEYWFNVSAYVKKMAQSKHLETLKPEWGELYDKVLLWESHYLFDSYMLYLEKDREPKERFYLPRRNRLMKLGVVQALQDIEDDKYEILTLSLPPGTGKTTIEKFFLSWVIGKHPEMYNLFYSHSDGITRMFYDGVLDITTNPEYKFKEIFPDVKMTKTDAKAQQITFNNYKPFPNLQTGTIDSNLAGKVRCNGYLLCDDLIGKMEQALNKVYLDKLWEVKYAGDAKQRKMTGCKEIHIATRWSVHDIIGRIMNLLHGNERARFVSVDCYDENGESNFDYDYGVGLTTEFLHEQELFMDDISFKCLYRNQPIEREGLLYHEEDIRRYSSLPLREPDAILGICDTKNTGTDFMFLPCMYKYDEDYYLVDCICSNNSDYEIQYENCANIIVKHNMQMCEFESNNGGSRVAHDVNKLVEKKGGRCNITDKYTETNKETRIIVNAPWVKKHVLFKSKEDYSAKEDYGEMMSWLFRWSTVGKTEHDDVPDGLANFALFVTGDTGIATAEAVRNPYRRYR